MAKQICYDAAAREKIRDGVRKLARAVKVTLGPRGRNVIIEKSFGSPTVTKDGVTVSKEIDLDDPYENMGAQLVKQVAQRTNDQAGDGTTTATVLASAIFNEGLKYLATGVNTIALRSGIDQAVAAAVLELVHLLLDDVGRVAAPFFEEGGVFEDGRIDAAKAEEARHILGGAQHRRPIRLPRPVCTTIFCWKRIRTEFLFFL